MFGYKTGQHLHPDGVLALPEEIFRNVAVHGDKELPVHVRTVALVDPSAKHLPERTRCKVQDLEWGTLE